VASDGPHAGYFRSERRMYPVTSNISYDSGCGDEEFYRGMKNGY
jgi:hypothetical protein